MDLLNCPICGAKYKKKETPYSLQDGEICMNCADDLRFLYPVIYLPNEGRGRANLDRIPQCQSMTRQQLAYLKKTIEKIKSGTSIAAFRVDLMRLLTLEQFRQILVSADAYEDRLRMQFLDYTNVFTVDYARPLRRTIGKDGIQNIRKRKTGYCAAGYIRTGRFQEGDSVGILHNGQIRYADILAMDYESYTVDPEDGDMRTGNAEQLGDRADQGRRIRAGYQVTMVLNEKAAGLQAGDWIVTD